MNFDTAFAKLMGNEGGYVNNPMDPGGETMYGITARVARAHGYTGDMRALPLATAKQIARAAYWDAASIDQLPDVLRFDVFDGVYNSGQPAAVKWLQQAVGAAADGVIGPATIAAANAADVLAVARFNGYRAQFLTDTGTWGQFGKGWTRRLADNLKSLRA